MTTDLSGEQFLREGKQFMTAAKLFPDVTINNKSDLADLPVLRKDEYFKKQTETPPFGGMTVTNASHIFQSPGPIYEPGGIASDWWRFGRFAKAIGISSDDIVLNTFSYHFTPAGAMFESGAHAVSASVFPSGPGQSTQQAEVAAAIGATTYAGTPDFLQTILAKADEHGHDLSCLNKAAVSAGPLFPQMREDYMKRGIVCRQCYATADVGLIAYETTDCIDGMLIDDDIIVEIVTPGTNTPLPDGEVGEVVVTVLNPNHPLLRFSVGDLSAIMTEPSPTGCGRPRLVGWRGRADQATKVRGMFVRPEQVARIVDQHPGIERARVEVSTDGSRDQLTVKLESSDHNSHDQQALDSTVAEILKLKADVVVVPRNELPKDGIVIADLRPVPGDTVK